jgi:hypothetical protein
VGEHRFALVTAGVPHLNQPELVDLVWLLHQRYGPLASRNSASAPPSADNTPHHCKLRARKPTEKRKPAGLDWASPVP